MTYFLKCNIMCWKRDVFLLSL